MEKDKTARNFGIINFKDYYDQDCSLQESSLAGIDCIWFGVDNPEIKYMKRDYARVGLPEPEGELVGWEDYPIPHRVSVHSRMHLTKEQVKQLLPHLQKFVETGEL